MATTFEKTWQKLHNTAMSTTSGTVSDQNFVFFMKAFLMGQYAGQAGWTGLWTLVDCSDGSSHAASDLWGSTFDAAKIVNATAGNPHSWVELCRDDPDGNTWYLIIDCCHNSYQHDYIFALSAFTGGSTTARPTSTDEFSFVTSTSSDNVVG